MKKLIIGASVVGLLAIGGVATATRSHYPQPTASPTASPSASPTSTPTPSVVPTPTPATSPVPVIQQEKPLRLPSVGGTGKLK